MTARFDCEGCAARVYGAGIDKPPEHMFCAVCQWLCEHIHDPEEFWRAYRFSGGARNDQPRKRAKECHLPARQPVP